jgi:hypothetical protein
MRWTDSHPSSRPRTAPSRSLGGAARRRAPSRPRTWSSCPGRSGPPRPRGRRRRQGSRPAALSAVVPDMQVIDLQQRLRRHPELPDERRPQRLPPGQFADCASPMEAAPLRDIPGTLQDRPFRPSGRSDRGRLLALRSGGRASEAARPFPYSTALDLRGGLGMAGAARRWLRSGWTRRKGLC